MLCDQSGLYELNEQDNFKGLIFISKSRPLKFSAIILKIIKTSILFQYKLDDPNQQPVIDNSIS